MGKDKISTCAIEMVCIFSPDIDIQLMMYVLEYTDSKSLLFQFRQNLSDQSCFSGT